jgi:hypothetical protein
MVMHQIRTANISSGTASTFTAHVSLMLDTKQKTKRMDHESNVQAVLLSGLASPMASSWAVAAATLQMAKHYKVLTRPCRSSGG